MSSESTPSSNLRTGDSSEKTIESGGSTPQLVPETIPDDVEEQSLESKEGKLKTLFNILKKFIGVKDMANVRFSLPAQLMEPVGNLEYWTYLDRPDAFITIPDAEDPVRRMLNVTRFWFSKDCKFANGRLLKPYNSVLGEFFRCYWDVAEPIINADGTIDFVNAGLPINESILAPQSSSGKDNATSSTTSKKSKDKSDAASISGKSTSSAEASLSKLHINSAANANNSTLNGDRRKYKIAFLTEQTSHHPPVSAFYVECQEKGIRLRGMDQIAAKFTGTTVKIFPGEFNKGVFIDVDKYQEEYHCTHPTASVTGFLRGSPYACVLDTSFIYCRKNNYKTIINYIDESWVGKPRFLIEGVCFKFNPEKDNITSIKKVPESDVLFRLEGSWKGEIRYRMGSSKDKQVLIDLNGVYTTDKLCPDISQQLPYESRKNWEPVTKAIKSKQFQKATKAKIEIEDRQRKIASERKEKNEEFIPVYFKQPVDDGKPEISQGGRDIIGSFDI